MNVSGRRLSSGVLNTQKRISLAVAATALAGALIVAALPPRVAYAAQITDRSLTLQAGATDGGSKPAGNVNHLYTFDLPTNATIGSIQFEYCMAASGTCVAPAGLSTTTPGATLGASTGAVFTGITNSSANVTYISRTAANFAGGTVTARLDGVINPTATNSTFFARISTYASEDATGSPIDTGTVAASTSTEIELTGTMPESLIFCTGETIGLTGGIPDCTTATPGEITFNQLFSPTDTATATSQMAASTNASAGYSITVNGPTLTSGSNTITALASPTASTKGTGQFGMNLRANTTASSTVAVGADVAPTSNTTDLRGNPQSGYNAVDTFKFVTGESVAQSDNNTPGFPAATNAQIYTASYIVNVPGSQAAGTYVSTLTYICTPTF